MTYDVTLAYNDLADILHLLAGTRGAFDAMGSAVAADRGPATAALGGRVSERLFAATNRLATVMQAAGLPYPSWPDYTWAPRPGSEAEQTLHALPLEQEQALELEVMLNLLAVAMPGLSKTLAGQSSQLGRPPFLMLGEHAQRLAPLFAAALQAARVPGAGQKVIPPYPQPQQSYDFCFSLPDLSDLVYVIAWAQGLSTGTAKSFASNQLVALAASSLADHLGKLGEQLAGALEAAHVPVVKWEGLAPEDADRTPLTVCLPGKLVGDLEFTLFKLASYYLQLSQAVSDKDSKERHLARANACDRLLVACSMEIERLGVPRPMQSETGPLPAPERSSTHHKSVAYAIAMNLAQRPVTD